MSAVTCLVLASALLHAGWNAILKRQEDTSPAAVAIIAIAGVCSALFALALSRAAWATPAALAWTALSGACEAAYFLTLSRALAVAPLGTAYTISRGGSLLFVWPIAVLWLGERAGVLAAAGATLVFVGLVATGGSRVVRARGAGWALACAVFIASTYLVNKRALAAGAEPAALFAGSLLVALPINVALLGRGGGARIVRSIRAKPVAIGGAGIVCAASFLLFLSALETSGAGRVLTLRNTSVVFAHAFGWLAGERPNRVQIGGGALVVAGAALLGFG
jgi:drug/metabolite transporter (DMT)-like permease